MNQVDKFFKILSLDEKVKTIAETNLDFCESINQNFNLAVYNCKTLLLDKNETKKTDYFINHINAFSNHEKTLYLAKEIQDTFNFDIKTCIEIATIISKNKDVETKNFCKNVISMLKNFLNTSESEIILSIQANPELLKHDMKTYYHNLYFLKSKFLVQSETINYIFKQSPLIFSKHDILSCVKIFFKCLALSSKEFNRFLIHNYTLLLTPSKTIRKNIGSLIYLFEFTDSEVTCLVRANPKILLIPKKSIHATSRALMHNFSVSEKQVKDMFQKCPSLACMSASKIEKKFKSLLSSNLFVKRDLKEIILYSPQILAMPNNKIASNILNISKYFNLTNDTEVSKFIRQCPQIVTINNLNSKLNNFKKYQITSDYLKIAPNVLSTQSIISGIKNALLYPFNLSYELDEVLNLDIVTLIQRIKYLSQNSKNMKDTILPAEIFNFNYIDANILTNIRYYQIFDDAKKLIKATCQSLKKINNYYYKLCEFFSSDYIKDIKLGLYIQNQTHKTTNRLSIEFILTNLGFDISDTKTILNVIPKYIDSSLIISNIELLNSFKLNREQIINVILRKPIILLSNTRALSERLQELCFDYNDNLEEIYKHL